MTGANAPHAAACSVERGLSCDCGADPSGADRELSASDPALAAAFAAVVRRVSAEHYEDQVRRGCAEPPIISDPIVASPWPPAWVTWR